MILEVIPSYGITWNKLPLFLQERIAKAHGSQCGFCTPGMVMSMYALLRNKPKPTMDDITQALGGSFALLNSKYSLTGPE